MKFSELHKPKIFEWYIRTEFPEFNTIKMKKKLKAILTKFIKDHPNALLTKELNKAYSSFYKNRKLK